MFRHRDQQGRHQGATREPAFPVTTLALPPPAIPASIDYTCNRARPKGSRKISFSGRRCGPGFRPSSAFSPFQVPLRQTDRAVPSSGLVTIQEAEECFATVVGPRCRSFQRFCPRCGKGVGAVPLMPVEGRIAGHVRLLGIFWLAISAFRLIPSLALVSIFHSGFPFFPPGIPGFVHGLMRGWEAVAGGRRDRHCGGLGVAGTATLGAHAGHCSGVLQPARHAIRHGAGHLHAVGPAARPARKKGIRRIARAA